MKTSPLDNLKSDIELYLNQTSGMVNHDGEKHLGDLQNRVKKLTEKEVNQLVQDISHMNIPSGGDGRGDLQAIINAQRVNTVRLTTEVIIPALANR